MSFVGPDATREFLRLFELWSSAYRWKVTSAVIVRTAKTLFVQNARVYCTSVKPSGLDMPLRLETPHILALREITEFKPGPTEWIENAANGNLDIEGKQVSLLTQSGSAVHS